MIEFCVECKLILMLLIPYRQAECAPDADHIVNTIFHDILCVNLFFELAGVLSEDEEPCDIPDGFYDKLMP